MLQLPICNGSSPKLLVPLPWLPRSSFTPILQSGWVCTWAVPGTMAPLISIGRILARAYFSVHAISDRDISEDDLSVIAVDVAKDAAKIQAAR